MRMLNKLHKEMPQCHDRPIQKIIKKSRPTCRKKRTRKFSTFFNKNKSCQRRYNNAKMSRSELPDHSSLVRWTVQDVANWLVQSGFPDYVKKFRDGGVDGSRLANITDTELERLKVPMNMKKKKEFLNHIANIKGKGPAKSTGVGKAARVPPHNRPPAQLPPAARNVPERPQTPGDMSDGSDDAGWADDDFDESEDESYENDDLRLPPRVQLPTPNGPAANGPVTSDEVYEDPDGDQPPPIIPRPGQPARPPPLSNPPRPPEPGGMRGRPPPPVPAPEPEQDVYEDPDKNSEPQVISPPARSVGIPRTQETQAPTEDYEIPDEKRPPSKLPHVPPGARRVLPIPPPAQGPTEDYEVPEEVLHPPPVSTAKRSPGLPPRPLPTEPEEQLEYEVPEEMKRPMLPGARGGKALPPVPKPQVPVPEDLPDYIEPDPDIKPPEQGEVYEIPDESPSKPLKSPNVRGKSGWTDPVNNSKPSMGSPRSVRKALPLPPQDNTGPKLGGRPLPVPPPSRNAEESLESYPWYHGNVARPEADTKLKKHCTNGMFLIRKSTKHANQPYTLVLFNENKVYNLPIRKRDDGKYALGMEKKDEYTHTSIPELIEFFKKNLLVLAASGHGQTQLTKPAPKS